MDYEHAVKTIKDAESVGGHLIARRNGANVLVGKNVQGTLIIEDSAAARSVMSEVGVDVELDPTGAPIYDPDNPSEQPERHGVPTIRDQLEGQPPQPPPYQADPEADPNRPATVDTVDDDDDDKADGRKARTHDLRVDDRVKTKDAVSTPGMDKSTADDMAGARKDIEDQHDAEGKDKPKPKK